MEIIYKTKAEVSLEAAISKLLYWFYFYAEKMTFDAIEVLDFS